MIKRFDSLIDDLHALVLDEDLTDDKLREASESLLPNLADALQAFRSHGWLIWSNEHAGWWVAGRSGYTQEIAMAGVYNFDDACEICHDANKYLGDKNVPHETMVLDTRYEK